MNTLNPEIAVKRLSGQEHRKKGQHSEKLQKPGGPWWQKGNTRDWCPDVLEERTSLSPCPEKAGARTEPRPGAGQRPSERTEHVSGVPRRVGRLQAEASLQHS